MQHYEFWHMEDSKFEKLWKRYTNFSESYLENVFVAKLEYPNVDIELEIEKEDGCLYITPYTCVKQNGEWHTEDFLSSETLADGNYDLIKSALNNLQWDELQKIMLDILVDYCKAKNIVIEERDVTFDIKLAAATKRSVETAKGYCPQPEIGLE